MGKLIKVCTIGKREHNGLSFGWQDYSFLCLLPFLCSKQKRPNSRKALPKAQKEYGVGAQKGPEERFSSLSLRYAIRARRGSLIPKYAIRICDIFLKSCDNSMEHFAFFHSFFRWYSSLHFAGLSALKID